MLVRITDLRLKSQLHGSASATGNSCSVPFEHDEDTWVGTEAWRWFSSMLLQYYDKQAIKIPFGNNSRRALSTYFWTRRRQGHKSVYLNCSAKKRNTACFIDLVAVIWWNQIESRVVDQKWSDEKQHSINATVLDDGARSLISVPLIWRLIFIDIDDSLDSKLPTTNIWESCTCIIRTMEDTQCIKFHLFK